MCRSQSSPRDADRVRTEQQRDGRHVQLGRDGASDHRSQGQGDPVGRTGRRYQQRSLLQQQRVSVARERPAIGWAHAGPMGIEFGGIGHERGTFTITGRTRKTALKSLRHGDFQNW